MNYGHTERRSANEHYTFKTQHGIGQSQERILDAHFRREYQVIHVPRNYQRQGIDRWFLSDDGGTVTVEYKADYTAARTGNAFIETVSVDSRNVPGWAYSSQADVLVYFIPPTKIILSICFQHLREHLPQWLQQYPTRSIPNAGYNTIGLLVPLRKLEAIAFERTTL